MIGLVVNFLILIGLSHQAGFQKDLDLDITFPPILDKRPNMPTGHLRPLGWQNRPEGPVSEEEVSLGPEKFWDNYINKSKPVVIRGLVMGSDAAEKWSDVYLNRAYGQLDIKVTERRQKYHSIEENKTRMSLKKFLQNYRVEDWYLRGIMPHEMQSEASIPHLINCGPFVVDDLASDTPLESGEKFKSRLAKEILASRSEPVDSYEIPKIAQLIEPYIWISAGETSSLLHSHPEHNLHCVLDGRKDFILIPTRQFEARTTSTDPDKKFEWRQQLDLYETFTHSDEWYSKIDVDRVNAYKHKILSNIKWYWASLRTGDCIFIPNGWLHQIRSYGRSISTSVYFNIIQLDHNRDKLGAIKSEQFGLCEPMAPLFTSLSSVSPHFLWTYTHTERHLNRKTFTRTAHAKSYLLYLIRQDEQLFFERFADFFDEITREIKKEVDFYIPGIRNLISLNSSQIWTDFFDATSSDHSYLSIGAIGRLKMPNLDRFIKILNLVANFHEYGSEYKVSRDEL